MTSLAFHNDPALAAAVRQQVQSHYDADEIVQGLYWENGKGCFIGCIAHGNDTDKVQQLTGFPVMLTRIAEGIFEDLPSAEAKNFLPRMMAAPSVGADLSTVAWKFLRWCVTDALERFADCKTQQACQPALDVLTVKASGGAVAADAAADAADAAADAAAYAAAAGAAAYAAAYAAAGAADAYVADAYAADAAAGSAACAAGAAGARIEQAEKLIQLLSEA